MKAIKLKAYTLRHKTPPKCTQDWLNEDASTYLCTTCPVHGNEALGGFNGRITIRFNRQVKYYTNEPKDVGTLSVDGYNVGTYKRDRVWLYAARNEAHEVHLIRDGVQVTFTGFLDLHRAMRFVKGLKVSPESCEQAFNAKLAENIAKDAGTKYPEQYSDFLCNALRDTLALSNEQAIAECLQLIEILKDRKNK